MPQPDLIWCRKPATIDYRSTEILLQTGAASCLKAIVIDQRPLIILSLSGKKDIYELKNNKKIQRYEKNFTCCGCPAQRYA